MLDFLGGGLIYESVVNPTWVATPLTVDLIEHPDWKQYVMRVEDVAEVIVQQVLSGEGGQIILPEVLRFVTGVRGWPSWAQNWLTNSVAMDLAIMPGSGAGSQGR